MKFNDYQISDEIKKTLDKLNFKRPTDIQFKSIPSIIKGEDVLAIAQTGTGKTAAFAIPIINKIFSITRSKRPDAYILIKIEITDILDPFKAFQSRSNSQSLVSLKILILLPPIFYKPTINISAEIRLQFFQH